MKNPEVSVIIPAYNAEKYIKQTINSVLEQSFQSFEIIVVNDGSTDKTRDIVSRLQKENHNIKLIDQINSGVSSARNNGIKNAQGGFIAFLDADDLWHPEKLLLQVSEIKKDNNIGVVSCLSVLLYEDGKIMGWQAGVNLNGYVYKEMIKRNPISCGSIALVRKDLLPGELFDSALEPSEDWDFWLRICKNYKLTTVPKVLVGYRRASLSASKNYQEALDSGKKLLNKTFANDINLGKSFYLYSLSRLASTVSGLCIIDAHTKEAWKYMYLAFKCFPVAFIVDFQMFKILTLLILNKILTKNLSKRVNKFIVKILFNFNSDEDFIQWCKQATI